MVIAVPVAALVLVAAGCGGSSTDSAGGSTATIESVDTSASTDTTASTETSATDTTATDTGSTDTGSTDTSSATDTGATDTTASSGNASFAGCPKLAELSTKYAQILGAATSGNGKTDIEAVAKAYKSLAEEVPEEILASFRTLADAFTVYAEAFKGIDLSSVRRPTLQPSPRLPVPPRHSTTRS